MTKEFDRASYKSDIGFEVAHTEGFSAENSTISYPHQTPMFMLYYFIQGSGNIKIEGSNYNIKSGDIIILNPAEMFCCSVDANIYHERIVLHFSEKILNCFPGECQQLYSPFLKREKGVLNHIPGEIVKKYGLDNSMKSVFSTMQGTTTVKNVVALCKITELLSALCEIFKTTQECKELHSTNNPLINEILEYLNSHFRDDVNLNEISAKFNINKSYLSHLFKENMGISLWNYVIFRRVSFFNDVVKNKTTEEASRLAGFKNYSNFFRIYKKHTGITPLEYKKQSFN